MPVQPDTTSATAWPSDDGQHQRRLRPATSVSCLLAASPVRRGLAIPAAPVGGLGVWLARRVLHRAWRRSLLNLLGQLLLFSQRFSSAGERSRPSPSSPRVPSGARRDRRRRRALALAGCRFRRRGVRARGGSPRAAGGVADWLRADAGAGRVEQADRLVRQLAIGDVAVRQLDRVLDGLIENADLVMLFQRGRRGRASCAMALATSGSSTLTTWKRRLRAASVFEIFLVLHPGGGRDGAQLAAGQGRLEQVGGVALARPRRRRRSSCGPRR